MKKKAPTIAIAPTPSAIPTPMPAFAPEVIPDGSNDAVGVEDVTVSAATVAEVTEIDWVLVDADADDVELLMEEEMLMRGNVATAVPAMTGASALNTKSSSLQQLVFRPVTPASSVPCGVQQNSFIGSKQ